MQNMQATIPSANDRPPIDFKKGVTKLAPASPPKVYTAKEAAGQLAEHMSKQYPPGEVPDSIKLAQARAAGLQPQPVHEDPFNPTPEDHNPPTAYTAQQVAQLATPAPQQVAQQPVAMPPHPQATAAVPLAVAQAQATLEAAQLAVRNAQAQVVVANNAPPAVTQVVTPIMPAAAQEPDEVSQFLDARIRVTLTLQDGTFAMPATAIRETEMAVFVFFPDTPNSVTFVPTPGTQLKISTDRGGEFKSWDVYYPGSYVTIGELSQTVVAFIKAED